MSKLTAKKQARRAARKAKAPRSEDTGHYVQPVRASAAYTGSLTLTEQEWDRVERDQARWEASLGPCGVPVSPSPTTDVREYLLGGYRELDGFETNERAFVASAEAFSDRMSQRGWVFDSARSDQFTLAWIYPPSESVPAADDDLEPFTTLQVFVLSSLILAESDFSLMMTGHSWDAGVWQPGSIEHWFAHIDAVENYRTGDDPETLPFARTLPFAGVR
ncbi:hypothetical protein [Nocardia sp. XZ_19_369]|uniref:hypothetical protein n=1 Tax=Nocardia sp. XZ_19_369 TaxID=2769487 RepID=UPI00188EF779|nr:hypothetical protein [Nocardia sp. XZ_19_369]